MTDDSPTSRRQMLRTVGIGATVALAGCSTGGNESSDGNSGSEESSIEDSSSNSNNIDADMSSPDAVVKTYYQTLNEVREGTATDRAVEAMNQLIWKESTFFRRSLRESLEEDRTEIAANLASVETTVTDKNISAERLSQLGFNDIFSEDEIATIAEENANVEATIKYTGDRQDITEDLHITAKINDDWLIIAAGR